MTDVTACKKPSDMTEKLSPNGSNGLQVIGTGLPRTGTSSLSEALEILNFGPCHHFSLLAKETYPYPASRLWRKACLEEDKSVRQRVLHQLYGSGGYQSGVDHPTSLFVDDLVEMYPEAKFVHGVRSSPLAWRKSVNDTVGRVTSTLCYWSWSLFPFNHLSLQPLLHATQVKDRRRHGNIDVYKPNDSIEIYERHNEWVRSVVPKDRLLEFNPADGWEPLCEFLGVPVPADKEGKRLGYPRTNDTANYKRRFVFLTTAGLILWALLFASVFSMLRYLGFHLELPELQG